jgi:hypothetical protein
MSDGSLVLLIDPAAGTAPPLDLLRRATAARRRGLLPVLRRGIPDLSWGEPVEVVVTGVFSWDFPAFKSAVAAARSLWPSAQTGLSGVLPRRLGKKLGETLDAIVLDEAAEEALDALPPDYSLVPEWDASVIVTSKGVCPRECSHCDAAWRRSGVSRVIADWPSHVDPRLPRIEVWDNTLMLTPRQHFAGVADRLEALGKPVDFVCGLTPAGVPEAELEWRLQRLRGVAVSPIRLECNQASDFKRFHRMLAIVHKSFARTTGIRAFALVNAIETPDLAWKRLERIEATGVAVDLVVFTPHDWLSRDPFVFASSGWSTEHIDAFQKRWPAAIN